MSAAKRSPLLSWTVIAPIVGIVVLAFAWGRESGTALVAVAAAALMATVLAAVHHAEVVAHRVGEPYGSLVLAVAVTVIEVALIVTVMASGGHDAETLARDTVFAAVMITTNGIVGISLLLGALKYGTTLFNPEGSGAALATVATLAVLGLVLPTFTTSAPGPEYTASQLVFAAVVSIVLYG
ncbi:MAG: ionic transporter y4hA, partial [Glycomyces artemisiae]|nr:ionic transporter y4hA [Glycomyces artemisiae]